MGMSTHMASTGYRALQEHTSLEMCVINVVLLFIQCVCVRGASPRPLPRRATSHPSPDEPPPHPIHDSPIKDAVSTEPEHNNKLCCWSVLVRLPRTMKLAVAMLVVVMLLATLPQPEEAAEVLFLPTVC